MFGDGRTKLQPAYADDVATAIAEVVRQSKKPYPIYELAGPRVYSYEELLRTIARSAGLRMRIPFALWDAVAGLAEVLPQPPSPAIRLSLCRSTPRPQRTGRDFAHSEFLRDRLKKNSKQCSRIAKLKRKRRPYQVETEVTVITPVVLPWPLHSSLEAATRALFDPSDRSSID